MRRYCFPTRLLACVLALVFAFSGMAASKTGKPVTELERAAVGDTVVFGAYEQDNDLSNGKEAVEWIAQALTKAVCLRGKLPEINSPSRVKPPNLDSSMLLSY